MRRSRPVERAYSDGYSGGAASVHRSTRLGGGHIGKVDQVEEVVPKVHDLWIRPIGLAVLLEVVVHQIVRWNIGRRGVKSPEAEDQSPGHIQTLAMKDPLVEVIVDHHAVQETEVERGGIKQGVAAGRNEVHPRQQPDVYRDDANLPPLARMAHQGAAHCRHRSAWTTMMWMSQRIEGPAAPCGSTN
ncbi:MAG: hypothetical protein VB934_03050, partial [Polyangiaceae bacterium]